MRNLKIKQIKKEAEEVSKANLSVLEKIYIVFLKFVNPEGFFKKVILFSMFLMFVNMSNTMPGGSTSYCGQILQEKTPEELYVESIKMKMKTELVSEVDNYIKKLAPSSTLTPEYLVDKCLEYKVDIIFVLSQALLESHFGTKGKASETNSVWNVGTYDNGQILYRYKTANESVEPYLKLITEKYLIHIGAEGDTIYKDLHHLVEDRGYTNYEGKRFATARGYEDGMRKLMVKIDMETSISFYQDIIHLSESQLLSYFKPDYNFNIESNILYALN